MTKKKCLLFVAMAAISPAQSLLQRSRQLQSSAVYPPMAGYQPKTDVTDEARIDLDQIMFQQLLAGLTQEDFDMAQKVYQMGGYSQSVSRINLVSPLPFDIKAGENITGKDKTGFTTINLIAFGAYGAGKTQIDVQYVDEGCNVGGLPNPVTTNCLPSNGTITVGANSTSAGQILSYYYTVLDDTFNARTLQSLSTTAGATMRNPYSNQYFPDFAKFVNYYGTEFYADAWVTSAIKGMNTNFKNGNGDFAQYDFIPRAEVSQRGTVYLAVWMYVIRMMEMAVYYCNNRCITPSDCPNTGSALNALDQAVAFYTGSLEGPTGSGNGVLLYELADARAIDFKTAGPNGNSVSGTSKVNIDIFQQFSSMQNSLLSQDCMEASIGKQYIASKMAVPLIQGTLRYAYLTDTNPSSPVKIAAEGAVYSAAILPIVAACNQNDAATIYQNMQTNQGNTCDFVKVKDALENNYACMGIQPSDVGGLWDAAKNNYYPGAGPSISNTGVNVGLAVGLSLGGLFLALLVGILCLTHGYVEEEKEILFKDHSSGNEEGHVDDLDEPEHPPEIS